MLTLNTVPIRRPARAVRFCVVVVGIATLATACMSALQRTLPTATRDHESSLSAGGADLRVAAPTTFSSVWNAIGRILVRDHGGVAEEHPETGTIVSAYTYSTPASSDPTVSAQVRTRLSVVLPPGSTDPDHVRVTVTSERRERRAGGDPSTWSTTAAEPFDNAAFTSRVRDEASGAHAVALGSISWAASPADAARTVARHLTLYTANPGDGTMIETEWRTTDAPIDDGRLLVRSRLRFVFDDAGAGATRISVLAEMQYRVAQRGEMPDLASAWTDMDAHRVEQHGWAAVQQALHPVAEAAAEQPVETFASAAPPAPDLADPRDAWGRGGATPPGVARTTSGGEVVIAWLGQESATDLLGRAYTSDLQPGGQVGLMGAPVAEACLETNVMTRMLSVTGEVQLTAGYLVVSGHVGRTTEQSMVVHEAYADTQRFVVPEFADFSAVSPSARYYVAAVTTGRAVAVSFAGDASTVTFGAGVEYEGWRAGIENSVRQHQVSCHVLGRGVSTSLSCDDGHVPTSAEVVQARDGSAQVEPVVTRITLRRIPSSIVPVSAPQSIVVTQFSVDGALCADAFDDPPDLRLVWSVNGQTAEPHTCPGNSQACALSLALPPGTRSLTFTATDLDLMFDDPCGAPTTFDVSRWRAAAVDSLPPGPIEGVDHGGGFTVSYRAVY